MAVKRIYTEEDMRAAFAAGRKQTHFPSGSYRESEFDYDTYEDWSAIVDEARLKDLNLLRPDPNDLDIEGLLNML